MKITENPEVLKILGVKTLESQGGSSRDYPTIPVDDIAEAIEYAYWLGFAKGERSGYTATSGKLM